MASERFGTRRGLPRGRARFVLMLTIPALALGACVALAAATGNLPGTGGGPASLAANPDNASTAAAGDIATQPQDPSGQAISMNQTVAQAASSLNCTLAVPANPLTAAGLATPYQLGDGCQMSNSDEQPYVEATILAPGGQVTVYNPLVITAGTRPAATPAAATVPSGAQVIIDMGFNGSNLVLTGTGAQQGNCIDALGQSVISQTPTCNAAAFYSAANSQITAGTLTVPALGTGSDSQPCPTTESFSVIDQDQSDNVDSTYLLSRSGQTAQDTAANAKQAAETPINNRFRFRDRARNTNRSTLAGAQTATNASDDGLLDAFVDPALGCQPWSVTDPTAAAGTSSSQALNALSARQNAPTPDALVPPNDPQMLVNGQNSVAKANVYRAQVDEPLMAASANADQVSGQYCQDMDNTAAPALETDQTTDTGFASPIPAQGSNLYTFLASRLDASNVNLSCSTYGITSPVTLTLDGNGVATAATMNTTPQQFTLPGAGGGQPTATPTPTGSGAAPSAAPTGSASAAPTGSASAAPTGSASASPSPTSAPQPTPTRSFGGF